jgi:multidrug resistance protein, MATE family
VRQVPAPALDELPLTAQPQRMSALAPQPVNHAAILRIAVPIMLSNVTEPLIGVVNTAVVGRLPGAHLIGGVAVGALIFSFLFWGFGFLRLSTSGLAAQATGAGDGREVGAIVWRSLLIAVVVGLGLIVLSPLLQPLAIGLMGGSADVQAAATTYFSYRIWAAPAALANFTILGWFIGQGRTKVALVTQLTLNVTNMVLSSLFVLHFNMGIAGVGLAVVIAEYAAVALGLVLVQGRLRVLRQPFERGNVLDPGKIMALISANADMMIRTVCLLFAFAWFTARGARHGDVAVAANAVLLHMFEIAAYMIDGFAYAAEALVGQAIGARNRPRYDRAISLSTLWVMAFGALASLLIWLFGGAFIDLMTVNPEVRAFARAYLIWAAITPFLGAACFLYDGIFTGAMATRDMRNMMLVSLLAYMVAWSLLESRFGNHGLWAALSVFLIARSVSFAARLPAIKARVFGETERT